MDKEKAIENLLARNVEEVIQRDHLRDLLRSGKRLRVKLGIDPTSSDLHLGHAVVLGKLREFQDLGHTAVLIIGDFTAQIGDPSGRDKTRPPLTAPEVKTNMKKYLKQAGKIIDLEKAEIVYNSAWLGKMKGVDFVRLVGLVTVQQLTEREDFHKRLAAHQSIRMHELLYPILQGYDSVAVKADVELGGSDQLFNLLVGRAVQEASGMPAQDVLTAKLLVGLDGERKMSKSLGNYVGLDDEPNDMFGKVMSLPDALIPEYFEAILGLSRDGLEAVRKELGVGTNPKVLKQRLAGEIVKRYHSETAAKKAREHFEKLFSRHEVPEDAPELKLKAGELTALDIVVASGAFASKSEARRLIEQGGFEFDGKAFKKPQEVIVPKGGEAVRIGKKKFFKVKV